MVKRKVLRPIGIIIAIWSLLLPLQAQSEGNSCQQAWGQPSLIEVVRTVSERSSDPSLAAYFRYTPRNQEALMALLAPIFSTYKFKDHQWRIDMDRNIARPSSAQIARALEIYLSYELGSLSSPISFEDFVLRFHLLSRTYDESGDVWKILKFMDARPFDAETYDQIFYFMHTGRGKQGSWLDLRADVDFLMLDALLKTLM